MKEELGNSRMVGCWGSSTCTSQNSLALSLSVLHELSKKKKKGIKRQGEKKKRQKKQNVSIRLLHLNQKMRF